ncbi:MdpB Microcystin-dependent protein [uncultured Caudovirales phage]|uniref:MdpB Microcystin-dependent protein n=1 Tax=uncultured Caudovirales phage TaxID=2100421 RepID=A0A6J5NYJ8_9CAUD|nr:MdpB Microcystin-dependent protein [uncultured Caudovirales phage]
MPSFTANYNLIKPNVNDPVDEDLWGGYLNDDLDDIDGLIKTATDTANAAGVPIGSIVDYAGTSAPSGFLFCFGQAVSRTVTYAALFAAIGTTYGTGDGATTFNLPDFRGRVGAGQDDMGGTSANRLTGLSGGVDGDVLGATGGLETHTLLTAEMPAHAHTTNGYTIANSGAGFDTSKFGAGNEGSGSDFTLATSSTGGGSAHNNVQPTIIVNKIIRFA